MIYTEETPAETEAWEWRGVMCTCAYGEQHVQIRRVLVITRHGRRRKQTEDETDRIPDVPECAERRYRQQAKCLYKSKRIEIISSAFSNHNSMKLESII